MAFRVYKQIEMFGIDCPRCGERSLVLPPQTEAEFLDIRCGHCRWHPFYYLGGDLNYEETNIRDFQLEQY